MTPTLPAVLRRAIAALDAIPQDAIALAARVFAAAIFWQSGQTKLDGWRVSDTAIALFRDRHPQGDTLVVAGGVAANAHIRDRLESLARSHVMRLVAPPPSLCGDNAVMIAWAGHERLALALTDPPDTPARARWPLDPDAEPAIGAGVKA